MKSISKPQSLRFLHPSWLGILLAVLGCGGTPEVQSTEPVDATGSATLTAVRYTGALPENGYCGYVSTGVDDKGHELVEGEQYAYGLMNENLANDPELRAATGLESVATCEDARAYSDGYAAYRAAGLGNSASVKTLPADFPAYLPEEVDEPKARLQADGEVPKILNGQLTTKSEVVQFVYSMDEQARSGTDLYKKYASCTAVRIAGPLFLTAAHCINPYLVNKVLTGPATLFEEIYELNTIEMKYKDSGGVKYFRGRCNSTKTDCDLLSAKAYIHPKYTGAITDSDTDLAVIYIEPASQTSLRNDFPTGWTQFYSWLAPQTPASGQALTVYGWGPVNNTDSNYWKYQQRSFPSLQTIPINGDPSRLTSTRAIREAGKTTTKPFIYGSFGVTTTSTKSLCQGDSGGPAYSSSDLVLGVATRTSTGPSPTRCLASGLNLYYARVDYSPDWLATAVRKLQNGESPAKVNTCKCAFVGTSSDPFNWENPSAHISCAIGCTNPALLIP